MEGTNWVRNVLTTCFVYCGPFFLMFCFNNTVAWTHRVRAPALHLHGPRPTTASGAGEKTGETLDFYLSFPLLRLCLFTPWIYATSVIAIMCSISDQLFFTIQQGSRVCPGPGPQIYWALYDLKI